MLTPPSSCRKRAPPAYEANENAGIGAKPKTRSGPHFFEVYSVAAEISSTT